MSTYNLPYKYELEYAHLNGHVAYNLGKPIQGRTTKFGVTFKKDSAEPWNKPGVTICQWINMFGTESIDATRPETLYRLNPSYTTRQTSNVTADKCDTPFTFAYTQSTPRYTDPATGTTYYFYISNPTGGRSNHRFIGCFTKVYLKAGEILNIAGTCDDALYIRLDGECVHYKNGHLNDITQDNFKFFNEWSYTATKNGFHSLAVIMCNIKGNGGRVMYDAPGLRMTLAPAGSKLTIVDDEDEKPLVGNTVGDRCRVQSTLGSAVMYDEYIWTAAGWKPQAIGNDNLTENRFFIDESQPLNSQYILNDRTISDPDSNSVLINTESHKTDIRYGGEKTQFADDTNKGEVEKMCAAGPTRLVYECGALRLDAWNLWETKPQATAFSTNNVWVGGGATATTYDAGLVGNLYSAEWSDGSDTNEWYPVKTFENQIALYNWRKATFVLPTIFDEGEVTEGPVSHAHDELFLVQPMPYDREVEVIHSDGNAWFPDGYYPAHDKTKPYDFKAPSDYVYCVVDHLGNPCLYDIRTHEYIYNLGVGRVYARKTIHTHDALFSDGNTKRIRAIPGNTVLLTGTDINYAYKMVDTLPDPNVVDTKVAIPTQATDGFAEGQVVIARKVRGVYRWSAVATPTEGVGVPTSIRSSKIGNKVNIRWKDPDDALDPTGTTVARKWKYTRVVRRVGSYPKGPYDGAIVVQNSVKDYYDEHMFIDTLPPNVNGIWYYKLFAYSDDDVVSTSNACQFTPFELDWSKMSNYIQTGKAPSIFGIGDEIVVSGDTPFTGVDSIWNDLTFVVAGFDEAKPTSSKLKHSVTLVSKILPLKTVYDKAWGQYRLLTSGKVDKSVEYYVKTGVNSYKKANPQPTPGTSAAGYYIRITDSRATNGASRWSESSLRTWLNAVKQYEYIKSEATTVATGKTYYKQNADGTYTAVDLSLYINPNPAKFGWYERTSETKIEYVSNALPPLLALKQMDILFYNCVISTNNTAAIPAVCGTTADIAQDRVGVPSYTQITGDLNDSVKENNQIQLFTDPNKRIRNIYGSNVPTAWWTRSAVVDGGYSTLYYVSSEGEIKTTTNLVSTAGYGVCLVITLG